jgi:small-conductance mechanosensitive channel
MRTCVKVGVMYGSPIGKVTHLALKAAANHDRVFDKPAPFVLFSEFGDNALQFELHFWVAVRTLTERRVIESDIRFNIDHLFREAGIVIAYPQRDMHVYTHEPIQVQMHALPPQAGNGPA